MKYAKYMMIVAALCCAAALPGCRKKPAGDAARSIAVFVPGTVQGSAIYEMMADGVRAAVADWNGRGGSAASPALVTVVEGGFNQAEWEGKVLSLAAGGRYGLIVSSNPSMPAIAAAVSRAFPEQRFLLLDGELAGNPRVYSLRYNQREQGFLAGHIAGLAALDLIAKEPGRWKYRVGLAAAQEYPAMNGVILPGFLEGARAVDPRFEADFRIVGNWYDAARAAELAEAIISDGAPVLLTVAGSANQGVLQAAAERGAKVVWFDTAGCEERPGVVVGSAILLQERAAREKTLLYLEGALPFGAAETAGIAEGFVDFADTEPLYLSTVSEAIRRQQDALLQRLRSGELRLPLGE
ncbi:MAG: BMP family ABC transporter substrate-binding protein [Treponema sp.]|jgi:simple sugar transport system substrate-binding protein|nr:BMP family ABC transporter substrate-binding protein [Treponema sp.]